MLSIAILLKILLELPKNIFHFIMTDIVTKLNFEKLYEYQETIAFFTDFFAGNIFKVMIFLIDSILKIAISINIARWIKLVISIKA